MSGFLEGAARLWHTPLQPYRNAASAALVVGVVLIATGVVAFRVNRRKHERLAFVLATIGLVFLGATQVLATASPVQQAFWMLALVPSGTVLNHALLLYYVRRRALPQDNAANRAAYSNATGGANDEAIDLALNAGARHFNPEVIALRYGPAALALLVLLLNYSSLLTENPPGWVPLQPAALGLAGAYLYVCLQLGSRAYQSDITPGIALWCAFTVAAGPILAGICALVVPPPTPPSMGYKVLYFAAGFSPRLVVSLIDSMTKRLYFGATVTAPVARTIPLTTVAGIDATIEDRLREEGIVDAYTLASTDPFRLLRNTPFDKRTIACWIDNAILLARMSDQRDALEKLNIKGASELARWGHAIEELRAIPAIVTKVATEIRMDPDVFAATCTHFWEDAQVRLVWLLYRAEGDGTQNTGEVRDSDLLRIAALDHGSDADGRQRQGALVRMAARKIEFEDQSELGSELNELASLYEGTRLNMAASRARSGKMSQLMARARVIGQALGVTPDQIRDRFRNGESGHRVVALYLARDKPTPELLPMIIDGIVNSRSAFEQYAALTAARELKQHLNATELEELRNAVLAQIGPTRIRVGSDRYAVAQELLATDTPPPVASTKGTNGAPVQPTSA